MASPTGFVRKPPPFGASVGKVSGQIGVGGVAVSGAVLSLTGVSGTVFFFFDKLGWGAAGLAVSERVLY